MQIGLTGNNPNLYGYVLDTNSWIDVFGLDGFVPKPINKGSVFRVFDTESSVRVKGKSSKIKYA